jgi:hypothetical protein
MGTVALAVVNVVRIFATYVGIKPVLWLIRVIAKLVGRKIEKRIDSR